MRITIGYDFDKMEPIKNIKNITINDQENDILKNIISILSNNYNEKDFNVIAETRNYTTLKYKNNDIARIKYTDKAKWLSVLILDNNLIRKYENDPLFSKQKNKKQFQWKSDFNENNINSYIEILNKACEQIEIQ